MDNGTKSGCFCSLLAIVFITLKLLDYIHWSWVWVLAPLWIPFGIWLIIFLVIIIIAAVNNR